MLEMWHQHSKQEICWLEHTWPLVWTTGKDKYKILWKCDFAVITGAITPEKDILHIIYPITVQANLTSEASAVVLLPGSRRSPGTFPLPGKWPPAAPLRFLAWDDSSRPFLSTAITTTEGSTVHLWHWPGMTACVVVSGSHLSKCWRKDCRQALWQRPLWILLNL